MSTADSISKSLTHAKNETTETMKDKLQGAVKNIYHYEHHAFFAVLEIFLHRVWSVYFEHLYFTINLLLFTTFA